MGVAPDESVAAAVLGELAIAARSDPQQPDEGAPHHVDAAESGSHGHLLQAAIHALHLVRLIAKSHAQSATGFRDRFAGN